MAKRMKIYIGDNAYYRVRVHNDTEKLHSEHALPVRRAISLLRNTIVPEEVATIVELSDLARRCEEYRDVCKGPFMTLNAARLFERQLTSVEDVVILEKSLAMTISHIRHIDNGYPMYVCFHDDAYFFASKSKLIPENFNSRDPMAVHHNGLEQLVNSLMKIYNKGTHGGTPLAQSSLDFILKLVDYIQDKLDSGQTYSPIQVRPEYLQRRDFQKRLNAA
ncbi:hypothetical protein CZP2022_12 [Vibrio phage C-ZP2022]|nr:hypothetical protein CZP2022_12 [Vibrio phage C-ZP2022]